MERLHHNDFPLSDDIVRELVRAQLPRYEHLSLERVTPSGTEHHVYRLGDELGLRLPRHRPAEDSLLKELRWLPVVAPHLTLATPRTVSVGDATESYPFRWSLFRWIRGHPSGPLSPRQEFELSAALATFILELRRIDPAGGPTSGRLPLAELDGVTRTAIDEAGVEFDRSALLRAWEQSLRAEPFIDRGVWRHCDLIPPNVLWQQDRVTAVIDFSSVGVGDPAADLIVAWTMLGTRTRASFRAALNPDTDSWMRARGYALHQALLLVPYYCDTLPAIAAMGRVTIQRVLADVGT